MSVTIGGTFSGLNVSSIIQSIIAADSIPITNLQTEDTTLTTKSTDLGDLGTSLGSLSTALQALGSPTLFSSQTTTLSNTAVGSASTDSTAVPGSFSVDVTQLSTTTVLRSGSGTNTKMSTPPAGDTAITSVLNESTVQGQTFTINGKQITLSDTDVLDDGNANSTSSVIGKINNSGAGVTAAYNSTTGAISLSSSSPIPLGSGSDTSDFLQKAQLFNNGTDSVVSTVGIGRIDPTADLSSQSLSPPITAGTFTINGVPIAYNSGDTLNTLMGNINSSSAGVTATYDTYDDQLVLSATQSGPQNITVADGTSNAATALRLTSSDSTLQAGQPTLFTVNGSTQVRESESNVISDSALGVTGVTLTATGTGTTTVTVAPDVTTIAAALNAFVTQYNSTQTTIAQYTAVDTADSSQSGALATDTNLTFLAPELRQVTSGLTSDTAAIRMLSDLGIETNANDDTLTQVNTTDLQNALTNHLSDVQALFNDPTTGLTNTLQTVIAGYNDNLNGVIVNEQSQISQQITYNKNQITQMQANIAAEQTNLENQFAALDSVEASNSALSGVLAGNTSTSSSSGSSSSSSSSSSTSSSSAGSVGSSTPSSS